MLGAAVVNCDSDDTDKKCKEKRKKGALLGGAIGAAAGYGWGNHVASKKEQYSNQEAYLNDVIGAAEAVTNDAKIYNRLITNKISKLERQEQALEVATSEQKDQQIEIGTLTSELQLAIKETEEKINLVNSEIEIQKRVVANEKSTNSPKLINAALSGISNLESEQTSLLRALTKLKSIDERRAY
ncbi:hypothetical protein NBRC116591_34480 [Sessilibacter corallicola]|uniref:Uncharacterized protein n=1 Tax=Sessilibacter corallicola TaxID=2904075 RepID=A0ABQ0ADJ4_9GAMM